MSHAQGLGDVAGEFGFDIGAKLLPISQLVTCSLSEYSQLKGHVAPDRENHPLCDASVGS